MPMPWDGGEWEYPDAICSTCGETADECRCHSYDYDEADEADEQLAIEMEERD